MTTRLTTTEDWRARVCRAMDYLSGHLAEPLDIAGAAQAARCSPYHFHRLFTALVGETVGAFVRRLRLERAMGLLVGSPRMSVTDIAFACGFSSSQNFAKAFRAAYGLTPSQARRRKAGNNLRNGQDASALRISYASPGNGRNGSARAPQEEPQEKTDMQPPAPIVIRSEVQDLPVRHVAYIRKIGPYGTETVEGALGELCAWATPRGFVGQGAILCRYWDDPSVTPPERCRADACMEVPAGTQAVPPVTLADIPGGRHWVCRCQVPVEAFASVWSECYRRLADNGYECADRPGYELYHSDGSDGIFVIDVCIPLA